MKRHWFRDEDGTYFRNVPLIMDEQRRSINYVLPWRRRRLAAEWQQAWSKGVIRAERIGRYDEVVVPRPFREAYPNNPGLWRLDGLPDTANRA